MRFALPLMLFALLSTPAVAQSYFPGPEGWRTAHPRTQGMDAAQLERARFEMTDDQGNAIEEFTAIVIRNGYDVWHYGTPYAMPGTLARQTDWASCGRSLMATMFGMAMHEVGDPVSVVEQPVNQSFNSPAAMAFDDDVMVKHLLSYTSCADPPGSDWNYACNYFEMYKILRDVDGMNPAHRLARLGERIDASWTPFEFWGHGQDVPFLTIKAHAADAARWGYLWMNQGNWNGTQIVDSAFVDLSLQPIVGPDGSYAHASEGYQVHLNTGGMWGDVVPRDAYAALGAGGRIIFVVPSLNLVIASISSPGAYHRQMVDGEQHRDLRNMYEPILRAIVDR
ncbi:MAG: hypothetical protein AAF730_14070 [Bacteroidota bacterium]